MFKKLFSSTKNLFSKNEEKSHLNSRGGVSATSLSSSSAANFLVNPYSLAGRWGWTDLRAAAAWQFYRELSVVRDAIDLSADAFVTVPFAIRENKTGELITEVEPNIAATTVLKILRNPNNESTESEFRKAANSCYNVTGDVFYLSTAMDKESEPLEIYFINSNLVSETTDNTNIARAYTINTGQFTGSYIREELKDGRITYFNKNTFSRLWVHKNFNPDSGGRSTRGFSRLSSVFYEIESHTSVSRHNNAMLRNGVRPSGAIIPNSNPDQVGSTLTDEQINSLKASVQSFYGGADNAGNILVLDGIKEFKELSVSNKDMEFLALVENVTIQIYNSLRIPLPLRSSKTMTYSNFEEAKAMLIDLNTLPFSISYTEEMNAFLMPYFDDSGDYTLVVDVDKIPALEVRKMAKIDKFKDSMTDNEKRSLIGLEPIDGGDILAVKTPAPMMMQPGSKSKTDFIDSLRDTGKFKEDQIQKKADSIYGGE